MENMLMGLSDKIISLLKEKDFSFEELKEKTNSNFFELKDSVKELLSEKKIFKSGFPTKYSLKKGSYKKNFGKMINYNKSVASYKEIFLIITILLFSLLFYSVFLKNPFLYPGLEQRTFPIFFPFLLITILLYVPWLKLVGLFPKKIVPKETLVFLDKAKKITTIKELKQYSKEFFQKILLPYYPHSLIILSVISLFEIEFFSSFNQFFSPIALILIIISITIIILKQEKYSFFKEKDLIKYAFLFLLILVTISSLNFEQITFLTEPLKVIQFQLTIFTIILGAITFYQNKQVIEEIETEQTLEEKEEEKRAKEFEEKYPKLAGIPLIGKITKWGYKEGVVCLIILVLILLNSFLINIDNLDVLPLQNDEFLTFDAVEYILSGQFSLSDLRYGSDESSADNFYSRGLPFSLSVAFVTILLGGDYFSIFNLRVFSVILGVFSLIFLYLLFRKQFPKIVSLTATYFFSIFYLFVYHSRVSRFYSILLFLFILLVYLFIIIYENFPLFKLKITRKNILVELSKTPKLILVLIFVSFVLILAGLKIHYNVLFISFPVLIFLAFYSNTFFKKVALFSIFLISSLMSIDLFFYPFFPTWYFNQT
ncbi:MAG: hypothetical protein PHP82_03690, partial [Candidatus ainarchaeum sp.]|nr:hypothetical protein [Candidatus ainarchaeum sp.]